MAFSLDDLGNTRSAVYRPRMFAKIGAQPFAADMENPIWIPTNRIRSATLEVNNHNEADTLELEVGWSDTGIDPRFLRNAIVHFWLGDAGDDDFVGADASRLRFIGIANAVERAGGPNGMSVTFKCVDYTALFLAMKPFPAKGVPNYRDTLPSAWKRICDHTGRRIPGNKIVSNVTVLRDHLELRGGVPADLQLGTAVAERFARLASVPVQEGMDAWAVWQRCVGMMGLISFIERDHCVVTTTTDQFSENTAGTPVVVWGRNILDFREAVISKAVGKGIALTSFDPISGKTIEAFWPPPPHDIRAEQKRIRYWGSTNREKRLATLAARSHGEITETDYECHAYYGITDVAKLTEIAHRAHDETIRQAAEGNFTTSEMFLPINALAHETFADFDLLTLAAGDSVRIEIDPSIDRGVFANIASENGRVDYLTERGYESGIAEALAKNASSLHRFGATFHASRVRTSLSSDGDGGTFVVDVSFHNRIHVDEKAAQPAEQPAEQPARPTLASGGSGI